MHAKRFRPPAVLLAFLLLAACSEAPDDATGPTASGSRGSASGPAGSGSAGSVDGQAVVRFCNGLSTGNEDVSIELSLSGQTLTASTRQCAPVAKQTCLALPAGTHALKSKLNGTEREHGTLAFESGKGYLVLLELLDIQGRSIIIPRTIELESPADCTGLDYAESLLRTELPLPLEPFRAGELTFAKPIGFSRLRGNRPVDFSVRASTPEGAGHVTVSPAVSGFCP